MDILNDLETNPIPLNEEEKRHTQRLLVGLVCALLLTGLVLGGYMYLRKRHERQVAAAQELEVKKSAPKVEVFVDDAVVNGKTTTLGGVVHNISQESLSNLAVGAGVDLKAVAPETTELAPDARARYSLQIATQDYISATFLRVTGGGDKAAIPFKASPGTPRPPMDPPASKTIVVEKPRTSRGDEFINTPNNPGRVP
jgi:hypothetical protein